MSPPLVSGNPCAIWLRTVWPNSPELEEGAFADPTPAADIYSLGMLIFYMLTGGKRIARENVFAEEYGEHFAKGHRYGLLRLLLSRMVAPLNRRYGGGRASNFAR